MSREGHPLSSLLNELTLFVSEPLLPAHPSGLKGSWCCGQLLAKLAGGEVVKDNGSSESYVCPLVTAELEALCQLLSRSLC